LIAFTLPGIPSIYYGDEAGLMGFEDPLNRAPYPYGRENTELLSHYGILGKFRTEYKNFFDTVVFVNHPCLLVYKIACGNVEVVINCGEQDAEFTMDMTSKDYFSKKIFEKHQKILLKSGEYLLLQTNYEI
ncbi:MAG: hypothetical protein LBQ27_06080, partial [Clostridiales bacterium]|nr:hypothetical protein [Clostridiales bacterium]